MRIYIDYLQDIIDSCKVIKAFTKGINHKQFLQDLKTQFAVVRALSIIGEAVKKIPSNIKEKYTKVPWKEMAGMRDILIHDYFGTDVEVLWQTIKKDIPSIYKEFKIIIKEIK